MWKTFSIVALLAAAGACWFSYGLHIKQQEAMAQALRQREAQLVQRYVALIQEIIDSDLQGAGPKLDPKTVEEAIEVLSRALRAELARRDFVQSGEQGVEASGSREHESVAGAGDFKPQPVAGRTNLAGRDAVSRETQIQASEDAAFSDLPAVGTIVFNSFRDGNEEIYTSELGKRGVSRLTHDPAADRYPSWSSDGQHIVFASDRDSNGGRQASELYIMDWRGENLRRLTESEVSEYMPAWSPDGEDIVYSVVEDGGPNVYVMKADGSESARFVARGSFPRWAPDGRIVFMHVDDRKGIAMSRVRPDGDQLEALVWNQERWPQWTDLRPICSPDGERVLFTSGQFSGGNGIFDLYVLNISDQTILQLTSTPEHEAAFDWSPDSRHVLFSSNSAKRGGYHLYVMSASGGNPRRILKDDDSVVWASWRPMPGAERIARSRR
ncbi:MAG: hypothetical protein L0Y44_03965 [Phycisphaerales bacterium]|nr:hypothetical protein [Phycisphaerales bacterium]MCI0675529.1 hypothetical protein [Phycisphaerales bacterium]